MEEIKFKLTYDSPSVINSALSKLLTTALAKGSTDDSPEIQLLWEHCKSENPIAASGSAHILVELVSRGVLNSGTVLSGLLSCIPQIKSFEGLVVGVSRLLILNINQPTGTTMTYSHPFVQILRSRADSWPHILQEFRRWLTIEDLDVRVRGLELLRPVIKFLFCDPVHHPSYSALKHELLDLLIKQLESTNFESERKKLQEIMDQLLEWLQLNNKQAYHENLNFSLSLLESLMDQEDKLTMLCSLSLQSVQLGFSCIRTIIPLYQELMAIPSLSKPTSDVCTILLGDLFTLAPYSDCEHVIKCASVLAKKFQPSTLPLGMFVCSLAPYLSRIAPSVHADVETILEGHYGQGNVVTTTECSASQLQWDPNIRQAQEIIRLFATVFSSLETSLNWLTTLTQADTTSPTLYPVLSSVVVTSNAPTQRLLALELITKLVTSNPTLSSKALSLITCCIPQEKHPPVILALLKSLPKLAKDRTCTSAVLGLIRSLERPGLRPIMLQLLYEMWTVEGRCYPVLQKALEEPVPQSRQLEIQLTKAKVIRDICERSFDQYGANLLPLLNGLMNQCSSEEETDVACLATDGIKILCRTNVIDVQTTIKVLWPKLSRDRRPKVLVKLCELLGLAATFRIGNLEYQNFLLDNLMFLWKITTNENLDTSVRQAAIQAITCYTMEIHHLKQMPSVAKVGLKLPAAYCATPIDEARKPEDVLTYVPGECWFKLLADSDWDLRDAYQGLISKLFKEEVENLPRSVYSVSQAMKNRGTDPPNYNHLPEKSIIRAAFAFLLNNPEDGQLVKMSLEVLGQDVGRELPPVDWMKLQGYWKKFPKLFLRIIVKQCRTSRAAKVFLDELISSDTPCPSDQTLEILDGLKYIAKEFPPKVYQKFIGQNLKYQLDHALNGRDQSIASFRSMLTSLQSATGDESLDDGTKHNIGTILEELYCQFPPSEVEMFDIYLEALTFLSVESLEKISSPENWKTSADVHRTLSVRSAIACGHKSDTPLIWFNDCIEAGIKGSDEWRRSIYLSLWQVMRKCRSRYRQSNRQWLLELMGQMRSILRISDPTFIQHSFPYFFDIFSLALIMFSDTDGIVDFPFAETVVPLALARLLRSADCWNSLGPQLSEWMLLVKNDKATPEGCKELVKKCLSAFKYGDKYSEASVWSRLIV